MVEPSPMSFTPDFGQSRTEFDPSDSVDKTASTENHMAIGPFNKKEIDNVDRVEKAETSKTPPKVPIFKSAYEEEEAQQEVQENRTKRNDFPPLTPGKIIKKEGRWQGGGLKKENVRWRVCRFVLKVIRHMEDSESDFYPLLHDVRPKLKIIYDIEPEYFRARGREKIKSVSYQKIEEFLGNELFRRFYCCFLQGIFDSGTSVNIQLAKSVLEFRCRKGASQGEEIQAYQKLRNYLLVDLMQPRKDGCKSEAKKRNREEDDVEEPCQKILAGEDQPPINKKGEVSCQGHKKPIQVEVQEGTADETDPFFMLAI